MIKVNREVLDQLIKEQGLDVINPPRGLWAIAAKYTNGTSNINALKVVAVIPGRYGNGEQGPTVVNIDRRDADGRWRIRDGHDWDGYLRQERGGDAKLWQLVSTSE